MAWPEDVTSSCELGSSKAVGLSLILDVMLVVTEHLVYFDFSCSFGRFGLALHGKLKSLTRTRRLSGYNAFLRTARLNVVLARC